MTCYAFRAACHKREVDFPKGRRARGMAFLSASKRIKERIHAYLRPSEIPSINIQSIFFRIICIKSSKGIEELKSVFFASK
jgi:hypothetical protein